MKRPIRAYVETSVFGGCFDEGFDLASKGFLNRVRAGDFALLLGAMTIAELDGAPERVQNLVATLPLPNHASGLGTNGGVS